VSTLSLLAGAPPAPRATSSGARPAYRVLLLGALVAGGALAAWPGEVGPVPARVALAVLALSAGWAWLRRRAGDLPRPILRIEGRAGLSRDASLVVVEVDGRRLLLGVASGGVRLVGELAPAPGRSP
jgi:hypothetical protein